MHHNMEDDGGIFSFEHDEDFLVSEKKTVPYLQGPKPYSNCHNVCDTRLANFDNEEIVTIVPKENFSFDISAFDSGSQGWSSSSASTSTNGADTDDSGLSIMMGKVSLGHDHSADRGHCACCLSLSLEDRITIEGLRAHLYSCFTCGVQWREEQISLDCNECDGYALSRPCLKCEGQCQSIWTRDISKSHSLGRATWAGICSIESTNAKSDK